MFSEDRAEQKFDSIINNLRNKLDEKDRTIEMLKSQKPKIQPIPDMDLRNKLEKDKEIIEGLKRTIKEKEKENLDLNKRLEEQADFISVLSSSEETSEVESGYNLEYLQEKKYIFVSGNLKFCSQLRQLFPSSIFVEAATVDLVNVKVDAVVYFTKMIDHTLYWKVESFRKTKGIRRICCPALNTDAVLHTMYEEMKKDM